MEIIKRISEKEFKRMGGEIDDRRRQPGNFEFVRFQKVLSGDGREWAFPLFEKRGESGVLYAVMPEGFDIEN